MIGFDFLLGWYTICICLVDLLDLRYNKKRSIVLIPSVVFTWVGKGKSRILTLIISWLNLELNIIALDFDYYCDRLEEIIEQIDRLPEDDKEE